MVAAALSISVSQQTSAIALLLRANARARRCLRAAPRAEGASTAVTSADLCSTSPHPPAEQLPPPRFALSSSAVGPATELRPFGGVRSSRPGIRSRPPGIRRQIPEDAKSFAVAGQCEVQLNDTVIVGCKTFGNSQYCQMIIEWRNEHGVSCTYGDWKSQLECRSDVAAVSAQARCDLSGSEHRASVGPTCSWAGRESRARPGRRY